MQPKVLTSKYPKRAPVLWAISLLERERSSGEISRSKFHICSWLQSFQGVKGVSVRSIYKLVTPTIYIYTLLSSKSIGCLKMNNPSQGLVVYYSTSIFPKCLYHLPNYKFLIFHLNIKWYNLFHFRGIRRRGHMAIFDTS